MSFSRVYSVDIAARRVTPLPELRLRDIGATEPRDLESWLASAGADVFGRGIIWLARQDSANHEDRSDLVGIDENGALILAELKNGQVDEWALTQALSYAPSYADRDLEALAELYSSHSSKTTTSALFRKCGGQADAREQIEQLVALHEDREVNDRQQILLVGSDFSARCLRACDYLNRGSNGQFGVECWAVRVLGVATAPVLVVQRILPTESSGDLISERVQAAGEQKWARDPRRTKFVSAVKDALSASVLEGYELRTARPRGKSYGFTISVLSRLDGREFPNIMFEAQRSGDITLQFNDPYPRITPTFDGMSIEEYEKTDWWYAWEASRADGDPKKLASEILHAIAVVLAGFSGTAQPGGVAQ